jgi:membrane protein implicated in regulation of membrane protease activity
MGNREIRALAKIKQRETRGLLPAALLRCAVMLALEGPHALLVWCAPRDAVLVSVAFFLPFLWELIIRAGIARVSLVAWRTCRARLAELFSAPTRACV